MDSANRRLTTEEEDSIIVSALQHVISGSNNTMPILQDSASTCPVCNMDSVDCLGCNYFGFNQEQESGGGVGEGARKSKRTKKNQYRGRRQPRLTTQLQSDSVDTKRKLTSHYPTIHQCGLQRTKMEGYKPDHGAESSSSRLAEEENNNKQVNDDSFELDEEDYLLDYTSMDD
ncbi:hypothetical protein GH714_032195 [Hevea brasiliensis]|uniref:Uncharacterized protein n=1 Tax=Hevea brasiliensis TaxID=3981 RepID=A0A6A6L6E1_HEVBR|nr:hypothetical protein GH714_032195 [Hevea brasiliensis]